MSVQQPLNQLKVPITAEDPKEIEGDPTKWKLLLSPSEIIEALINRNIKHFGTADGTPFTTDPLSSIFGYTAEDFHSKLQDQRQIIQDLHPAVQTLVKTMMTEPASSPVSKYVTTPMLRAKFSKWRESTTTSPSGLHLGHWRAISVDYKEAYDEATAEKIWAIQEYILQVHANLINYALKWNYAYERWRTIITLMIFKEVGNIMIHRLRVIHLYEADFSALLGIKWRELTFHLFKNKMIEEGLYGSVPTKLCQDPVLLAELQYEISRCSRRSYAEGKADASGCYDNILPCLTSAISQHNGMPATICILHASTLEQAKYYLKVMFNVSDRWYQHSSITPIFGNGQGSTNSPNAWLFISNKIVKCYKHQAHGAVYSDPEEHHKIAIHIAGFVDDKTLFSNCFYCLDSEVEEVISRLKEDTQLFSNLLWATGGAMEPRKCNYSVLHWKFRDDGTPYVDMQEHPQVQIHSADGKKIISKVKYMMPDASSKYLGHYKDLIGNQTAQAERFKQILQNETAFLHTCHLTRDQVYKYHITMFSKKITYPMSTTFFSKKYLRKLQRPYHRALLQCLGYNKNTSTQVCYGSKTLMGIGVKCLYL